MVELSMVIPFYNEEDNIEPVLSGLSFALESNGIDYELVAVVNGSTDNTPAMAAAIAVKNKRVTIVSIPVNQGYGFGITSGFRCAKGDYIGFMCGDGQIHPTVVVETYQALLRRHLDFCKVCRVSRGDGLVRLILSIGYNTLLVTVFGINIRDINGTPKIMSRMVYEKLNLQSKDWFIDTEMMIQVAELDVRVGDVDAVSFKREKGKSFVGYNVILDLLSDVIKEVLR